MSGGYIKLFFAFWHLQMPASYYVRYHQTKWKPANVFLRLVFSTQMLSYPCKERKLIDFDFITPPPISFLVVALLHVGKIDPLQKSSLGYLSCHFFQCTTLLHYFLTMCLYLRCLHKILIISSCIKCRLSSLICMLLGRVVWIVTIFFNSRFHLIYFTIKYY